MVTLEDFTLTKQNFPTTRQQRPGLCQRLRTRPAWHQDNSSRLAGDIAGGDQCRSLAEDLPVAKRSAAHHLQHHSSRSGHDRRRAGTAAGGRQPAEGDQYSRADSVRSFQEHVLPGVDGRLGGSAYGGRTVESGQTRAYEIAEQNQAGCGSQRSEPAAGQSAAVAERRLRGWRGADGVCQFDTGRTARDRRRTADGRDSGDQPLVRLQHRQRHLSWIPPIRITTS